MENLQEAIVKDLETVATILEALIARQETLEDEMKFYGHSINNLEMLVKRLSHDFHEEQYIEPYTVKVSNEEWVGLEAMLAEQTGVNEKLRNLFRNNK